MPLEQANAVRGAQRHSLTTSKSYHDTVISKPASPDIPPTDGGCHFFGLSGELRNTVYAYALSMPGSVRYSCGKDGVGRMQEQASVERDVSPGPRRKAGTTLEVNQLKYVNKQLYEETHGLVLRYNDLVFATVSELAKFLNSCPESYYRRFRLIDVQRGIFRLIDVRQGISPPGEVHHLTAGAETIEGVFQFCRQNPYCLVRDHHPCLDARGYGFCLKAGYLQLMARKNTQILDNTFVSDFVRYAVHRYRDCAEDENLDDVPGNIPENFRFFPSCKEFDTYITRVMDSLEASGIGKSVEEVMEVVRDIFEHGI
ncbi:hypothetical protein P153DRAFT_371037 [Dothidotthia symphoricarpi CBS 119687]|uniref:Uncharacterized protein n=1 Tax=Dothidotthia symphoricarpi CBS 119687 TaxID=1392245 RepID=A0A6A5ZWM2_9PLEO|nr:uncharacterized protein P153DRAFT_371037 [Dothidotthia symphoricarpi CBS 119687]KAF2124152.1 hypothetical protein P153DRAFT_371037 [Dothidotthia symphoricarpi CBS 119687]